MTVESLPLGFRFGVFFFFSNSGQLNRNFFSNSGRLNPNPLDIRFQKVSGLSATVQVKQYAEGGENLYAHRFPEAISYENLVLERSMPLSSPLVDEFNAAMSLFKFKASNVMVTLFNDERKPIRGWLFVKAFPVRWATSDLDAGQAGLVIETMELAYARMQIVGA